MILNFFKRIITKIKKFLFLKKEIKLRNKRYYDFSLLEKILKNNRSKLKKSEYSFLGKSEHPE